MPSTQHMPIWVAGKPVKTEPLELKNPVTGETLAAISQAGPEHIEQAIAAMSEAVRRGRYWAAVDRQRCCERVLRFVMRHQEKFVKTIVAEAAKPVAAAMVETQRAITTLELSLQESTRIGGVQMPVDIDAAHRDYYAVVERVAVGPCLFITPFNFPLNLVIHKIGPAMASGCPFILKPSERTPLTALLIAEALAEAELPTGFWSVLPCGRQHIASMAADERIALMSFTGSAKVGWGLKAQAGHKQVVLELGGNAAVIVEPDADLKDAADRITAGAFGYAGQSCISVQRIMLQEAIAKQLTDELVRNAQALKAGDLLDSQTQIGPMIDQAAAMRIEKWVADAVEQGAKVLCGGRRRGAFYEPTLLTQVPANSPLVCEEAFGPVAVIERYSTLEEAIKLSNASRYGLQAGIFARDLLKAREAFELLNVGTVVINDVPTTRSDALPYGGVKDSGIGYEGVHFAVEHLTRYKTMLTRTKPAAQLPK